MAHKILNKTLVKDFGSLSPLHEETEVSQNSLASDPTQVHEFPVLRLWDRCTDCKSDGAAACSSQHGSLLRTLLFRKISTQSNPSRMLTAINPNVRISRGLPMGAMKTEILNYNVNNFYGTTQPLYKAGCFCKWDVLPDEIIGHWNWTTLTENPCWYRGDILPAFEKHDTLIRRTPNESTSSRSSAHRSLPKSLPKSLAKVLPKALPKVFSALTHRGAKNKSFEDTQTNVDTLPANQNGLVYGSTGTENIENANCPSPGGNDCANENNQPNGDDCGRAREDVNDAREDDDNTSRCGDRDEPSNVYHDAADARPVLSDCNDIEPAACGPPLSESNNIHTADGGPVLSDFNDTAPTSQVETYTTFYCSNSSVGGEARGYSGGGSYGGGYDGGYGSYDGGSD